jgi:hypothetical protein
MGDNDQHTLQVRYFRIGHVIHLVRTSQRDDLTVASAKMIV